jgi:hypothetical protein
MKLPGNQYNSRTNLFDNSVACLTVLQFFRLRAREPKVRQNCVFSERCLETEVSKQLYYINNKDFQKGGAVLPDVLHPA